MRSLASWRARHVALACALWLLLAPLLVGLGLVLAGRVLEILDGGRDIAMALTINGWIAVAGWVLPPGVLVAAWLRARSRAARDTA